MSRRVIVRWLVFAVLMLVVIAWVTAADGEHSALARSFLRNLFRRIF